MYYMGDYYQGDYYSGDPFLGLGKLWGGIKKGLKMVTGLGGGGGLTKEDLQAALAQRPVMAGMPSPGIMGGAVVAGGAMALARQGGMGIAASRLAQGFSQGFDVMPGQGRLDPLAILPGGRPFFTPGTCPEGFHKAKDGSQKCVRNRRMNVANPRALRRGLRRVAGFGKLAQRARRDIGRAATAVGVSRGRGGPVARHHRQIRAKAS